MEAPPCEAPLAMAVAALGAAQALAHLDGEPAPTTLDGTLEVTHEVEQLEADAMALGFDGYIFQGTNVLLDFPLK